MNVRPKLIIGVVIDQMRAEYLYRFENNYSDDGFKRLMSEGFHVKNAHYNYLPTATGPGHSSIYTGTTPANHGIVANEWYDNKLERVVYCAEDSMVFLADKFKMYKKVSSFSRSPKKLQVTTITDELKLFSNGRSKVIGVSLKDRGAIFPAGHLADAAYWYNGLNGKFVTSTYYKEKLPLWLQEFNNKKIPDSLLGLTWDTLLPIQEYTNSEPDNAPFEKRFIGRKNNTFPYDLKKISEKNEGHGLLMEVPQGNTLLTELVKAAVVGEQLGKGVETDFLTISYSSTDYIGHHFGIRSKELEDTYVRMDREIETLLNSLDKEVGKGNYTLFLTADHGGSDHPPFLVSKKLPGKFYDPQEIKRKLNNYLFEKFGVKQLISFMDKTQIYIADNDLSKEKLYNEIIAYLHTVEGIQEVFAPTLKTQALSNSTLSDFIKNSYHSDESGAILYHMTPGFMEQRMYGTTHGNASTGDTHVPLLWYGAKIPKGSIVKRINITQIVPSLSFLFNIPLPNRSDRTPIEELFQD